jgi:hypothetical protein
MRSAPLGWEMINAPLGWEMRSAPPRMRNEKRSPGMEGAFGLVRISGTIMWGPERLYGVKESENDAEK